MVDFSKSKSRQDILLKRHIDTKSRQDILLKRHIDTNLRICTYVYLKNGRLAIEILNEEHMSSNISLGGVSPQG
jgi:hypothetical protein